jgi:ABC-type dipeptide/oligopeptide/nickel transport system permease component
MTIGIDSIFVGGAEGVVNAVTDPRKWKSVLKVIVYVIIIILILWLVVALIKMINKKTSIFSKLDNALSYMGDMAKEMINPAPAAAAGAAVADVASDVATSTN